MTDDPKKKTPPAAGIVRRKRRPKKKAVSSRIVGSAPPSATSRAVRGSKPSNHLEKTSALNHVSSTMSARQSSAPSSSDDSRNEGNPSQRERHVSFDELDDADDFFSAFDDEMDDASQRATSAAGSTAPVSEAGEVVVSAAKAAPQIKPLDFPGLDDSDLGQLDDLPSIVDDEDGDDDLAEDLSAEFAGTQGLFAEHDAGDFAFDDTADSSAGGAVSFDEPADDDFFGDMEDAPSRASGLSLGFSDDDMSAGNSLGGVSLSEDDVPSLDAEFYVDMAASEDVQEDPADVAGYGEVAASEGRDDLFGPATTDLSLSDSDMAAPEPPARAAPIPAPAPRQPAPIAMDSAPVAAPLASVDEDDGVFELGAALVPAQPVAAAGPDRATASRLDVLEQRLAEVAGQTRQLKSSSAVPARSENAPAETGLTQAVLSADWGIGGSTGFVSHGVETRTNRIDLFLRLMIDRGASDFHLHVGASPMFRQSGSVVPMRFRPMRQADWSRIVRQITPPGIWQRYEMTGDGDFAYEVAGLARFRVNLFRQQNGGGAVFRVIPSKIMTLEELGMPPTVARFAEFTSGLILVTGPTGSGKSTTLAALIDLINRRNAYHIITIEDPIEFVHKDRRSVLHQREVGTHSASFSEALGGAVREDPDLILVGEMRDRETMSLALSAAEKGVLVFGTLHTNSATKTIDRIVGAFPVGEQTQVRQVLADTVRGIVSQQLLRKNGGGRVAALEVLFSNSAMANLVREGKTHQLTSLIQMGSRAGMVSMDDSLLDLVRRQVVTADAALEKAIDKDQFRKLAAGGKV